MLESIVQTCALSCFRRSPISPDMPLTRRHKLDKSRMIMVGDRLNTDIAFGNKGGIDTLMVLTGACCLCPLRIDHH